MVKVFTRESLIDQAVDRRIKSIGTPANAQQESFLKELTDQRLIPNAKFAEGFDFTKVAKFTQKEGQTVAEFIGTGSVGQQFFARQQYEVDAGRDMEPLLFNQIYNVVTDSTLPRTFTINTLGPAGIVFERIEEGGEVKFARIGSGQKTVTIYNDAAGIEYNEDVFIYNELFRLPWIERQFGIAANARQNHIHLSPLMTYSYGAANQSSASTVGTTLVEKYHNTLDEAITHSRQDKKNPRRGPYVLLCSSSNLTMIQRAVSQVPQQGVNLQSPEVFSAIRSVVAYDGWTGTRGKKETSYAGVTAGKAYLINLAYRDMDFQSFYKQELRRRAGDGDLSRFIVEQVIYNMRFGLFADPVRAIEEITLPT